jgi:(+)-pinoresinol hydroxylase
MRRALNIAAALVMGALMWRQGEAADAVQRGEQLFEKYCVPCHGRENAATRILKEKYQDKIPAALQDRTDLSAEFVKTFVRIQTPRMSAFRPTELSNEELAAVAAYLSRNNATSQ